jgi:hypothetical protein
MLFLTSLVFFACSKDADKIETTKSTEMSTIHNLSRQSVPSLTTAFKNTIMPSSEYDW